MLVHPGKIDENLKHAQECIEEAKKMVCDLVILPECFDIGWANGNALQFATPIPGTTTDFLCELAEKNSVYLVAGITEKENNHYYNTAVFISNSGQLLGKHRKIHLVPYVENMFDVGEKLQVYETPFGKIGINICADNLMDSIALGQSLGLMGAKLIVSPSSWAVPADKVGEPYGSEWIEPYTLLSKCYRMNIIGVSNVGTVESGLWSGYKCIGNSIAMGQDGELLAVLTHGETAEEIRIVECNMDLARGY